jgi:hypothetical protein
MGASLSTIQATLKERYTKLDVDRKGYLVGVGAGQSRLANHASHQHKLAAPAPLCRRPASSWPCSRSTASTPATSACSGWWTGRWEHNSLVRQCWALAHTPPLLRPLTNHPTVDDAARNNRNKDGRFTLDELLAFAAWAASYARANRHQEAAFMLTGFAALKVWSALECGASHQFVDWCVHLRSGAAAWDS